MYIAAATTSMRFEVSAPMRVENCIGSTCTENPASLPIAVMMSTITPWIVFDCVSRKVKGMPVGVEPTLTVCCASAGRQWQGRLPRRRRACETRSWFSPCGAVGRASAVLFYGLPLPAVKPPCGRDRRRARTGRAFSANRRDSGRRRRDRRRHLLDHLGHRRIVAASLAGFVLAQRPLKIILPLRADARDLVVPRQVGIVAEAAAMARRYFTPLLDPGRFGTDGGRDRRRQLRKLVRESPQVIVGEVLRELVHRLRDALLLAKDVELDEQERRGLASERGHLRGLRRARLAMAGEAGREPLRKRFGPRRTWRSGEERQGEEKWAEGRASAAGARGARRPASLSRHGSRGRPRRCSRRRRGASRPSSSARRPGARRICCPRGSRSGTARPTSRCHPG